MQFLKIATLVIGGMVCFLLADAIGIMAASMVGHGFVVNLAELIVSGLLGIAGGRILGRDHWYLVAAIPLLYFGCLALGLAEIKMLWAYMHMPLAVITSLVVSFHAIPSEDI